MLNNKRLIIKILKDIGADKHIKVVPHDDGWILELIYQSKSFFIHGYTFPNNRASAAKLCDDKAALSNILNNKKIPTVPHHYFMNHKSPYHQDKKWESKAITLLHRYKTVVVKPNNGTGGDLVFKVSTINELNKAINLIFSRFDALAISPYYKIVQEYRLIVLNNEVQLLYLKQRKHNEWRHNLQLGAQPIPVTNRKLLNVLSKLALQAIKTVGINFASVDIAQIGNTFKIMEINSGVMLEKFAVYSKHNYQIAKNIYSKAINSIILSWED